jgi:cell division protein FtsQ
MVHLPEDVAKAALQIPHDGSSLFYDTDKARDNLLRLGWVREASVRRMLPSRVHVEIVEREPFARWASPDGVVYVDREGIILGPANSGKLTGLTLFSGEMAGAHAHLLADALGAYPGLQKNIEEAKLIYGVHWQVLFKSGLQVLLPLHVRPHHLQRLTELLESPNFPLDMVAVLDLRLIQRMILHMKEKTEAARGRALAQIKGARETVPQARGKPL